MQGGAPRAPPSLLTVRPAQNLSFPTERAPKGPFPGQKTGRSRELFRFFLAKSAPLQLDTLPGCPSPHNGGHAGGLDPW